MDASTETSAHAQPAPTKKAVDKKTTPPGPSTPSKPAAPKPKIEKGKPLVHPHANVTTKAAKFTPKTEKPKSTEKLTTKPVTTVSTSAATSASTQGNADLERSVSVASKVEVHEGPVSVLKVKKSEIESGSTVNTVTPSIVEAKSQSEELKSTEDAKSSAAIATESSARSETPSVDKDVSISSATTPEEPALISSSSVLAPEYDYLSRQPSEVIDETFRVSTHVHILGVVQVLRSYKIKHEIWVVNLYLISAQHQPEILILLLVDASSIRIITSSLTLSEIAISLHLHFCYFLIIFYSCCMRSFYNTNDFIFNDSYTHIHIYSSIIMSLGTIESSLLLEKNFA